MNSTVCRRTGRAVSAAVVALGLVVVSAGPAAGAVPGVVLVKSVGNREAVARCPDGLDLLDAGFYTDVTRFIGSPPVPTVTVARPLVVPGAVSHDSMVIRGVETRPDDGTWEAAAFAICADPPPGLEVVSRSTLASSEAARGVVASCPKGKQLVGTGFEVGGDGQVIVEDVIPDGGAKTAPTSVYVRAYEQGLLRNENYPGDWALTAHAVCAKPLPGLVRVSASTVWSSDRAQEVVASCPKTKVVVGTGFEVHGALGRVVLKAVVPRAMSEADPPTDVVVRALAPDSFSSWYVDAYAICADA